MNWIDRTIAYVSPESGVRRAQARVALDMARAYEAAKLGRRTDGWNPGSGSANAEIATSLPAVRNRCRQMVRDNEWASRALDSLVSNTVGTGISIKLPRQQEFDDWTEYCDADGQLDLSGLIEMAHRCRRETGEVFIRFRNRDPDAGFRVPLQIQVLEPDLIDHSKTGVLDNGNIAICGVEFSPIGQRLAYWVFPVHPGEIASYRVSSFKSRRVPASEIVHYYRKRRPSQVRGMPEFATGLLRLRDMADYEQAELVRKKIEACFVAFVNTDNPGETLGQTAGGTPRNEKFSPGMIKYIANSDSVTFGNPSVASDGGAFNTHQLRAVAAGFGTSYELMTGDYSRINFSSSRAMRIELVQMIAQEQWLALVPMMLAPLVRRYQTTAALAGVQGAVGRAQYTMPRIQMVDPLKEEIAGKEAVRGCRKSLSELIRENGDDPQRVFAEIAAERKQLRDLGVIADSDASVSERLIDVATASKIIEP